MSDRGNSIPISRRQFLKISAVAGAVAAGGLYLGKRPGGPVTVTDTRLLMGTVINLAIVAPDRGSGEEAVAGTLAEMERLIRLFDHRIPETPLARLNRAGHLDAAPPEFIDLLRLALTYGAVTGGAFDVTVKPLLDAAAAGHTVPAAPVDFHQVHIDGRSVTLRQPGMALTLDGIAKGRVVDGAVASLQTLGYTNVLVEAGGDLYGSGVRDDGAAWRVGVSHPRAEGHPVLAAFTVSAQAVASSGDYRHAFASDFSQHHILDPRTRQSPPELAAATVLAPTAADADALSTAAMVLGPRAGLALLERLPHVEGLLITKSLQRYTTRGFPARV